MLVETGGEQEGRAIGKGLSQMGGERGKAGEGVERRHLPGDVGGGVVELEEKSSAAHFLQLRLPGPDSPQTMAMTEPLSLSAILDDPLAGTPGPRRIHPWTTSVPAHYRNIATLDMALAPLENSRFNRSKSALKWMEHSLHGTPMVLSDVPCYREAADDGLTALFAADATRFARQLRRLADDPALRLDIGLRARGEVLARHTIDRRVPLYREVLGL